MTPERWQQVDQVLEAALELPPHERAGFLDKACAGDDVLRQEVESLITAHQEAETFIETPAARAAAYLFEDEKSNLFSGRSLGQYQVLNEIGHGAMGQVYLAYDTKLHRRVALKILPADIVSGPDQLRRFRREARATSALNHPNILVIHDIGQIDDSHFIATEFVEGETLRQLISEGRTDLAKSLDIAFQVASALAAAHQAGIVHRDIKPENIMVRADGYVKVLDFGIAKLVKNTRLTAGVETASSIQTTDGMIIGTPPYMSPEQVRGDLVDARTDIFSLGIVLYEMITGRPAFEGRTIFELFASIAEKEPTPLGLHCPAAPADLASIVSKALIKDREQRYQTASEMMNDLESLKVKLKLENGIRTVITPEPAVPKLPDRPPRKAVGSHCPGCISRSDSPQNSYSYNPSG